MVAVDNAGPFAKDTIGSARVAAFRAGVVRLETLMRWPGMKVITAKVKSGARLLDHSMAELTSEVRHFARFSGDPVKTAAGGRMLDMLDHYGSISNKPYDFKTGTVKTVLDNMNGTYAADVTTLGLGGLKTDLQAALDAFEALLAEREEIERTKPKDPADPAGKKFDTWAKAKKSVMVTYREIDELVDSGSNLRISTDFDALINVLNPEIERFNFEFRKIRYDIEEAQPAPIPDEPWTGEERTPVPSSVLYERGGCQVRLRLGRHYDVSYKDNIAVGNAYCFLHGKGDYKGSKSVSFIIRRGVSGQLEEVTQEPAKTDANEELPVNNEPREAADKE
jgi:hypothetical protein